LMRSIQYRRLTNGLKSHQSSLLALGPLSPKNGRWVTFSYSYKNGH